MRVPRFFEQVLSCNWLNEKLMRPWLFPEFPVEGCGC